MMCKKLFSFVAFFVVLVANAQQSSTINVRTSKAQIDDFMDQRFGLFIHWGPVSLRGTEIGWSRSHQVNQVEYDSLYKEFNPVLFNADNWVKAAKNAGVKYLTITAKHHDGFCLWPSATNNYTIQYTPFKKDIVGALATACKKQGIKFCVYFTVLDWHDENYPIHNNGKDTNGNMVEFVKTMKKQIQEIISNYHPYMLWFDGNWEKPWTQEMGIDMYNYIKKLDPKIVINNRLGKGTHKTLSEASVGDYATPEQEIGSFNLKDPWESCITICNQWAWKPNDPMKSLKTCIQTLASTAGGNGNLLFNIGPMSDGRIEQRQITRLKEMGDWLKIYGESIYGTRAGPFKPDSVFASTRKRNTIYLQLFKMQSGVLKIPVIPGLKILKANFIKGDAVPFEQTNNNVVFDLPKKFPNATCSVLAIEFNADVTTLPIIEKLK